MQGQFPNDMALHTGLADAYEHLGRTVAYQVERVPLGVALMYVAGMISGLLGIGSGTFKVLAQSATEARYVQEVTLLGIRQRDVFERRIQADGAIVDRSVEGFNKGGEIRARLRDLGAGTEASTAQPQLGPDRVFACVEEIATR